MAQELATVPGGPLAEAKRRELDEACREVRRWIVKSIAASTSGHVGGSLSVVEILTSLYFHQARVDPQQPAWMERDRVLMSKGHAGPALYSVMALRGYFPTQELYTLDKPGTRLSKHLDRRKLPYCDISAGMLGQGLSIGVGLALGARLTGNPCRVFVVLGDGELASGQVWEAAMAGAKYRLNNLTAVVDRNGLQLDGATEEIMPLESLSRRWQAFGWNVLEVNGHDVQQLVAAYDQAAANKKGPTIILAKTVKGKGVSFIENQVAWHNKGFTLEEARLALQELGDVA